MEYFNLQFQSPKFSPFCKIQPKQWIENNLSVQKIKEKLPNIQFIQITRKSFIDRATSYCLANISNVWSVGDDIQTQNKLDFFKKTKKTYMNIQIQLDSENLKTLINQLLKEIEKEEEIIQNINPLLKVTYEEVIDDPHKTLSKILFYLGYNKKIEAKSSMTKMPEKSEGEQIRKMIKKYLIKII